MCGKTHAPQCTCGSENNPPNLFSPSTKWVLEVELRLSGLTVDDFYLLLNHPELPFIVI